MICLQETWLEQNEEFNEKFNITDKSSKFVSVGGGKGIAIYFPSMFEEGMEIKKQNYQIAAIKSPQLMIINIYRSNHAYNEEFMKDFNEVLNSHENQDTIIVCGDFNFCEREQESHPIRQMLLKKKFKSLLNPPTASHIEGRCLDQVYKWEKEESDIQCSAVVGTSSFSDHDPIFIDVILG